MYGVSKFRSVEPWLVLAAMLVVLPLPLAAPEDAVLIAVSESVLPYTETVVVPEVSYAYTPTSYKDYDIVEIVPEDMLVDSARAEAVMANPDELNVYKSKVTDESESGPRRNSIAWHNEYAFYVDIRGDTLYVKMIDVSTNTVTTWKHADKFYPSRSWAYHSPGVTDSSGVYYFLLRVWDLPEVDLIFRLDPNTGSLTKWNERRLVEVGNASTIFVDAQNNLYFANPSGFSKWGTLEGETFYVPESMPVVTLSSSTNSDRLGLEYAIVHVDVDSRGAHTYGTLTAPDGTYRIKDDRLELLSGNARYAGGGLEGVLGEYTATVHDRFGTATATITLTEKQKAVQKSSPRPTGEPKTVWALANKLDPDTNQITTFYREDTNLHMKLLEVDDSGTMYFGVFHGTRDRDATGIAKLDQSSGTITTWPNIQCGNLDVAVAGNKIYCTTHNNTLAELDVSSNTLRQWTDPEQNIDSSSIAVDSTGTVFFNGRANLVRFVPSTGTFTTFDVEDIHRVHVDPAGTLHAVQADSYGSSSVYSLTVRADVLDTVPERVAVRDAVPKRASEPAIHEPNAETASTPHDTICGPGTVRDAYGTCQLADRGGGCLVATAAHGTELAEPVQRLREAREAVLSAGTGAGFLGAFNHVYYSFSPHVADMERQNPALREAVRIALAPLLVTLQIMTFAETEAQVVGLGILAVSASVGVYGSPLALVVWIKRRFAGLSGASMTR